MRFIREYFLDGMYQRVLAKKLDLVQSMVSRWETGVYEPDRSQLMIIRRMILNRKRNGKIAWSDRYFFELPKPLPTKTPGQPEG